MKVITKKLSLEPFRSRMQGNISALEMVYRVPSMSGDMFYTYTDAANAAILHGISPKRVTWGDEFVDFMSDEKDAPACNYGMLVSDVDITSFSGITDYTDIYVNIPTSENSYYRVCKGNEFYPLRELSINDIKAIQYDYGLIKDLYPNIQSVEYYFYHGRDIYYVDNIIGVDLDTDKIFEIAEKKKFLTYSTLRKWYHFFERYNATLNSGSTKYQNLEEYYFYEHTATTLTENECLEMDTLYIARGGDKFFTYLKEKIFTRLTIPEEYSTNWKNKTLSLPEIRMWAGWFNKMYEKYGNIKTYNECKNSDNCCDCTKYLDLGGNGMRDVLNEFIKSLEKETISTKSASIVLPILINRDVFSIGEMSNLSPEWEGGTDYSTDNGYGTVVLSEESGDTFVIKGGKEHKGYTVNEYKEYEFNADDYENYTDFYMREHPEMFSQNIVSYAFKKDNHIVYNPNDENMLMSYKITRPSNGFVIINDEIHNIKRSRYVIYNNGLPNYLINNKKYLVNKTYDGKYYVVVDGKRFYAMKRNGAYYFNFTNKPNYKTDDSQLSKMEKEILCVEYNDEVLELNVNTNTVSVFDGNSIKNYPKLSGYFKIDDETFYIQKTQKGEIVVQDYSLELNEDGEFVCTYKEVENRWVKNIYYPKILTDKINILFPYTPIACNKITGHTDSKLSTLRSMKILTDDLGNVMPGYYEYIPDVEDEAEWATNGMSESSRSNSRIFMPYDGARLDLYYKVGNVSNLSLNELLSQDGKANYQYFNGGIIDKMRFYYEDLANGGIYQPTLVEMTNSPYMISGANEFYVNSFGDYYYDEKTEEYKNAHDAANEIKKDNPLSAIKLCGKLGEYIREREYLDNEEDTRAIEKYGEDPWISDNMICEIEYHINAILHAKMSLGENEEYIFDGYELEKDKSSGVYKYHPGVTYIDTYTIIDDTCAYKLYDGNSYTLKYYNLMPQMRNVILNDYGNVEDSVKDTVFSMPILIYSKELIPTDKYFTEERGFDHRNGAYIAPVFMKEFNIGTTTPQNIDADIYLDRGIQKSIDKHLRLQEITTMETLENYGNGIIKIT